MSYNYKEDPRSKHLIVSELIVGTKVFLADEYDFTIQELIIRGVKEYNKWPSENVRFVDFVGKTDNQCYWNLCLYKSYSDAKNVLDYVLAFKIKYAQEGIEREKRTLKYFQDFKKRMDENEI